MLKYFRSLLEHAKVGYSRTSALNPVQWIFVVSTAGLVGALSFQAPSWIIILFAVFASLSVLLFAFSYVFFMFRDPDAKVRKVFTFKDGD